MSELRYGRLVWARVLDRNGVAKERPCVIVTPTAQIRLDQPLLVVAVTTTFPDPAPPWHVELPWNPDPRRVRTGLARRSAAVVNWLDTIRGDDVLDVKGDVPPAVMRRIAVMLAEWAEEEAEG
jgi:mRNA-degrading endonuclease toxin of MazEF toxin-antitoxin module